MPSEFDPSAASPAPPASPVSSADSSRSRIVFMGTAELAAVALESLATDPTLQIQAAVSQPDRPRDRALRLVPTPVKRVALARGLRVLQPLRAKDPDFVRQIAGLRPDLIVVAAYGQMLPQNLLEIPPHGCLNVHTSLLPKYRGAAPIQWAIVNGDAETGVTLMRISEKLDAGDIVAQSRTPIQPDETAQSLHDRLAQLGAQLLRTTLPAYLRGEIAPRPQPSLGVSYARKVTKADGRVDWTLPAEAIARRVRAFTPWPGTYTHAPHESGPVLLKIAQAQVVADAGSPGTVLPAPPDRVRVACGQQALDLLTLQREGGRALPVREFLRGFPLPPGIRLISATSPP